MQCFVALPTSSMGFRLMSIFIATLTVVLSAHSLPLQDEAPAQRPEILVIPIKGTIGADITTDGLSETLSLIGQRRIDTVLVDLDARDGELEVGTRLAELIAELPGSIRVVGLLQRIGGPALPIAWACDEWLVQDSVPIRIADDRGGFTPGSVGADRVVFQTLPPLTDSPEVMQASLERLRDACLGIQSRNDASGAARAAIITSMTRPGTTVRRESGTDVLGMVPYDADDDAAIDVTGHGPGLRGEDLVTLGVARIAKGDASKVLAMLERADADSLGDTGALLIDSAADDRLARRGRLGSQIDSMFSALDGVASLLAGAPWSIDRARLSNPESPRLATHFPMRWASDGWVLDEVGLRAWNAACRDSIRRWAGVVELVETVEVLLGRATDLRDEISELVPEPPDRARWTAAVATASSLLNDYRSTWVSVSDVLSEARSEIVRLEALLARTSPPTSDRQ